MLGKRFSRNARPFLRMSRQQYGSPVRFISLSMARATMSRGASEPRVS